MATAKTGTKEKWLEEEYRAEDIILGSLGFGEEVSLVSICRTDSGFLGTAVFANKEIVSVQNEDDLSNLERWALEVLLHSPRLTAKS